MSGVIDDDGQQWEHCNICTKFVKIQNLLYEAPSEQHPYGRDVCPKCAGPEDKAGETFTIHLHG